MKANETGQALPAVAPASKATAWLLRSARLLIIASAAYLTAGSVLPQGESAGAAALMLPPLLSSILHRLGLFNVAHSPIAGAMIIAGVLCAASCAVLHAFGDASRPSSPATEEQAAAARSANSGKSCTNIFLKLLAGKNSLGRILVHGGLFIIVTGTWAGSIAGFTGYLTLFKGESATTVNLTAPPWSRELDFPVRLDDTTIYYAGAGEITNMLSDITIGVGEKEKSFILRPNHPARYGGMRFYQSNAGHAPEARISIVTGAEERKITVRAGSEIDLPGSKRTVQVLAVETNLLNLGPAVEIGMETPDGPVRFYLFQRINELASELPDLVDKMPRFNPRMLDPHSITVTAVD
ncbi:MAG: cytochrome c biogenesis protein ResB, partial [Deltaproteobacteria bacterium]|nr:cytochrome c biogenesis protein ResB [Deltaproteobacteria bacterium]